MYILKNNKLPKIHLLLNKYKIESKNDKVIEYRKTVISKDENNCAMYYFIHIFYHLQDNLSNICVSLQKYNFSWHDWGYDWYGGKYEELSIPIIKKYDKKLLKYIEHLKDNEIKSIKNKKEDGKLFKELYKNIKKQNFKKVHQILSEQ